MRVSHKCGIASDVIAIYKAKGEFVSKVKQSNDRFHWHVLCADLK